MRQSLRNGSQIRQLSGNQYTPLAGNHGKAERGLWEDVVGAITKLELSVVLLRGKRESLVVAAIPVA